ncbi:MAG TPA: DUF3224 domain-containing protein [Longimicrobiales bacterium]
MGTHVTAQYTVKSWDEKPVIELDDGGKLTRTSVTGGYTGAIEGEAASESVMCYAADGTAVFVGFERIVGRIDGREGSFILRSEGTYDGTEARATLSVVPGSGTGELTGLRGEGSFVAPHGPQATVELDYRL